MSQSQTARRALAARRRRGDDLRKPTPTARSSRSAKADAPASTGWPSKITVAELDELAAKHGVTFDEGATKAEKQSALDAAGVGPE